MQSASGGNHGSCSWLEVTVRQARQNRLSFTPFLHSRPTIKAQRNQVSSPGGTPFGRTASPRPRCIATVQFISITLQKKNLKTIDKIKYNRYDYILKLKTNFELCLTTFARIKKTILRRSLLVILLRNLSEKNPPFSIF